MTKKPIQVRAGELPWPFIFLPLEQVDAVKRVLEAQGVRYYTRGSGVSWDEGPWMTSIHLEYKTNVAEVQGALDCA